MLDNINLYFAIATIQKITYQDDNILYCDVLIDKKTFKAVGFKNFIYGEIKEKDKVVVNTTAVDLNLGTGGLHFIIGKSCRNRSLDLFKIYEKPHISRKQGHIIKLRYTPLQFATNCVEDENNPLNKKIKKFKSLNFIPVVVCFLHSQIAAVVFALKKLSAKKLKIVYIMNDAGALPLYLSNLVKTLKEKNLIDFTITCGQAFGGDYETINFYTALICAKEICKADVIICSQGFGNVGSNTKYGFSAICVGEMINAINILGGNCIVAPRISFADKRKRHKGISHHTLTVLKEIALKKTTVVIPLISSIKQDYINKQIKENKLNKKHKIITIDSTNLLSQFIEAQIGVKTMNRGILEDEEFFLSCLSAGMYISNLLKL